MEPVPLPPTDDGSGGEMRDMAIDDGATTLPRSEQNSRRFQAWVVLMAASALGIVALALERRKDTTAEKWSISVLVLSFVLALLGTLCYLLAAGSPILTGPTELGLVRIVCGWILQSGT
jgi:hypothetical protein